MKARASLSDVDVDDEAGADWHRRVVNRSLRSATRRSIDRGAQLVLAATTLLERSDGDGFTVQDVANEAGQSLRTLYQYFESKDDLLLAVFEETMRAYARLIRGAIAELTDPMDRLTGALVAAVGLPERSPRALKTSLTRLRLRLTEVEPDLISRAQAPVASLFQDVIATALPERRDSESVTFLLLSLITASIHSRTLSNDPSQQPAPADVVAFCLTGLGAPPTAGYLDAIEARLSLPDLAPQEKS